MSRYHGTKRGLSRDLVHVQGWAKEWALGCVNPASWLSLAAGGEFTQPRAHSFAQPCSRCTIFAESVSPPAGIGQGCVKYLTACSVGCDSTVSVHKQKERNLLPAERRHFIAFAQGRRRRHDRPLFVRGKKWSAERSDINIAWQKRSRGRECLHLG